MSKIESQETHNLEQSVRNDLFGIWLEAEFGVVEGSVITEFCVDCGGYDPLIPKKVYKLPRGNYCRDHILSNIAKWVNGGAIKPKEE